jgi:glycerol-3-phosphate dehydrogenase (NAD(P)+)
MDIGIIGAGAYGTALAERLTWGGRNKVSVYSIEGEVVQSINSLNANEKYFPGRRLSPSILACGDLRSLRSSQVIFLALPSRAVESVVRECSGFVDDACLFVNLAKGLSSDGDVLWSKIPAKRVASLKGPTFALEMFNGLPSALTFASQQEEDFSFIKKVFSGARITLDFSSDIDGVEYVSVLKNVYAIAIGIVSGRYNSPNVDFMLLTKALNEMRRFLEIKKCNSETVFKYCGIGDLGLTSLNDLSRNRTLGLLIGKGFLGEQGNSSVVMEGLRSVHLLALQVLDGTGDESHFPLMLSLDQLLQKKMTVEEFCARALA